MASSIRMFGTVTDAVRSLTFTRSGLPRFRFGVRVGSVRPKHYAITAYGSMAKFADLYLRTGQRVRIEGAYLRRYPAFEGIVRADMIRHVGTTIPPHPSVRARVTPEPPERPVREPVPAMDAHDIDAVPTFA